MIRTNIYQIRFSASQGSVWFWVVLAHESVVKMSARLPSSEGLTGAGIFASKMLLAGGLGSTPHSSGLSSVFKTRELASSRTSDPRKSKVEPLWQHAILFFFPFFCHQFDFYHHKLLLLFLNFKQIESSFVSGFFH